MPSSKRSRRSLLRTAGLLAIGSITGCLQSNESKPSVSDTTESTVPTSDGQKSEVRYYDFGEWYDEGDTRYTVTDWSLHSSFRLDDGGTRYELSDRQLLIADAKAENTTDDVIGLYAPYFAALTGDSVYRETGHIEHPELPDRISIADLRRVEHAARWAPQSISIEPHSVRNFSIVCVVPKAVTLDALEIGYEGPEAEMAYPIRWVPK